MREKSSMACPLYTTFTSALIFATLITAIVCTDGESKQVIYYRRNVTKNCSREVCSLWNDEVVNCSYGNCRWNPKNASKNIRKLILVGNDLHEITEDSFGRMTRLVYLDLSNCNLNKIASGAFEHLTHLEVLNMSLNYYVESVPDDVFALRNLKTLKLPGIRNPSRFGIQSLVNLTKLEVLWFGQNWLQVFPRLAIPSLTELSLEDNNLVAISNSVGRGLKSLKSLILSGNRISYLGQKTFVNFKNLTHLNLDRNVRYTPGFWSFSSSTLKRLSLNFISSASTVSKYAFKGIDQLEELSLERSTAIFRVAYPFKLLPNLIRLNLRGNGIVSRSIEEMNGLLRKLRFLDLSENELFVLKDDMFTGFSSLEVLLLSENWLLSVTISSFPIFMWRQLQRVDFSRNAFECDCNIVWFRRWLQMHWHNGVVMNIDNTNCTSPSEARGTPLHQLLRPTDLQCFTAAVDAYLVVVLVMMILISTSTTIASCLHRFRWHLKYYSFKQMTRVRMAEAAEDTRAYSYDAFICYCEDDRRWVLDVFASHLESEFQLRLCVQDRDWLFGEEVLKNFAHSIENSRKTVLMLSNAFAVSPWSHFEMSVAQSRFIEDDQDNLIVVLLEEIAACNMNPMLKLQLKQRNHIEWTEHRVGQRMFWDKLRHALTKPSKSLIDVVPPRELFRSLEL